MSKQTVHVHPVGIPLLGVLGVVLCTLKALDLTTMSWWAATSPFWAAPALILGFLTLALALSALLAIPWWIFSGIQWLRDKFQKDE
jgi:hypothetical protein